MYTVEMYEDWLTERYLLEQTRYQHVTDRVIQPVLGVCVAVFLEKLINESSIDKATWLDIQERRMPQEINHLTEQLREQELLGATSLGILGLEQSANDAKRSSQHVVAANVGRQIPSHVQRDIQPSAASFAGTTSLLDQKCPCSTASIALAKLVSEAIPLGRTRQSEDACNSMRIQDRTNNKIFIQETETIRHTARVAVEEALTEIPDAEKAAYLEVLRRAPHLIGIESNVLRFVRRDNYNAHDAARRLVMYWRVRIELFGERAFLPMIQTGSGALTQDDILILRWSYEEYELQMRRQCQDERAVWEATNPDAPAPVVAFTAAAKISQSLVTAATKDRKRRLNVIHSRLKRERRRAEESR